MLNNVWILPTGDEIKNGIVRDTDSPMIMSIILREFPDCAVHRASPLNDNLDAISRKIVSCADEGADLIISIGGSGEGSKHSNILAHDYTHHGMDAVLEEKCSTALYGKNGHMWSRLVCGFYKKTLVINVPGPYEEAKVAMEAFVDAYNHQEPDIEKINSAMAEAVSMKYVK